MSDMGWFCLGGCLLLATPALAGPAKVRPVKVTLNQITADGAGAKAGTVTIRQTKEGLDFAVDLKGLTPGEHGFHLHENPSCDPADKEGKKTAGQAAGAHWDPETTKAHKGPGGGGHKGDLPKLIIPQGGKLKATLPVAGLALTDVEGKSLMVHAGGDNYADDPKPLGGGGDRIVCGVIPGGASGASGAGAGSAAATQAPSPSVATPPPATKPPGMGIPAAPPIPAQKTPQKTP